ncbi:MAG: IS5 family transposase ISBam3 [Burkholderia gladioli]|nr:MAG: IS5 family transposase ISBam3 [Burkholderia gladioli]
MRQHGYSKRRTWRKVHLALNANTGQVHAALMTNQNVADGDALAKLLDQIPREEQIDVIGGDGAYDTKPSHAMRPLLHAVLLLRFRNARVLFIGQRICPVRRGVMARLMQLPVTVVENGSKKVAITGDRLPRMRCIRFKTLTGNCL